MIEELGPTGTRRWDLLEPVVAGALGLHDLFDAWRSRDLDGLLTRIDDVDLATLLMPWSKWLTDQGRRDAPARYPKMLATLHPPSGAWPRSTLTRDNVIGWLQKLGGSGGTKRKYAAALSSFVEFAIQQGQLRANPLEGVKLPKQSSPKCEFLDRSDVERLVTAAPPLYGGLFALLYGTGAEVGAALKIRRRDVDLSTWTIRVRGTKNFARDREVIVAEWARPYVANLCRTLIGDAPLFPLIDRWKATKNHKAILESLGIRHMKLHAARNHWAVRALRGGFPVEAVSRQLGHADAQMVIKVYGRFISTTSELARLEAQAEVVAVRRSQDG